MAIDRVSDEKIVMMIILLLVKCIVMKFILACFIVFYIVVFIIILYDVQSSLFIVFILAYSSSQHDR